MHGHAAARCNTFVEILPFFFNHMQKPSLISETLA
jgi:hypothetical protein